MKNEALEFNH